jgi:hypothetical protein
MAETLEQLGLGVEGDRRIDQRAEVEIRRDPVRAHNGRAPRQQGCFRGVAANRRDDREPVERLMKGDA